MLNWFPLHSVRVNRGRDHLDGSIVIRCVISREPPELRADVVFVDVLDQNLADVRAAVIAMNGCECELVHLEFPLMRVFGWGIYVVRCN